VHISIKLVVAGFVMPAAYTDKCRNYHTHRWPKFFKPNQKNTLESARHKDEPTWWGRVISK